MIIGIILLAIAAAELFLGLRFIFGYEKRQATIWYGLFCIGVAGYVGANGLGYLGGFVASSGGEQLAWVGGVFATIFFWAFSFSYPLATRSVREIFPWLFWPILIFVPSILLTDLFVGEKGIQRFGEGYSTDIGRYFWFFVIFIFMYWIWSISNLIRQYHRSDGLHRWQLRMILLGIFVSLVVSMTFDIVYPLVTTSKLGYIGSLFTSVWLGFTSYILIRK